MERSRSSGAAPRTRKRGALQDISNNAKKLSQPRARRGAAAIKKEAPSAATDVAKPQPRASLRRKTAASTVNSALKSSMASTAASKAKKRAAVSKKAEAARAKKRRLEGAENQPPPPHHKVQTSMLAFQARPAARDTLLAKQEADKENAEELKPKLEPPLDNQAALEVKQEPEKLEDNQADAEPLAAQQEETPETQEPDQRLADEAVVAAPRDDYAPRPYTFTFDHRSSCFDRETYAAAVRDIDAPSPTTSSHHAKLVRELDAYYRKHETKYLPEADYIGTVQLDINEKMRTILVDWLVEVGEEYELDSLTFHKAVNLVDRCLRKIKITRKQFQLLGCACMMIAAKFEEVYGPNVEEFVYISDQTYTAEEMLDMEAKVLNALEYRVASTTCYGFMHRYMKAGCTTDKQRSLVSYLCDFALLYYHMVRFKPSILVASAVYLARLMTGETDAWTPTLHHVTQYNPLELQDCIVELHRLHSIEVQIVTTQQDKAKAVSEKYLADKFHSVSTVPSFSKDKLTESFDQYSTPS
ncbi:Cyclin-like protein [Phytophthora cinnamomi]|uniref:Cyclin-like protein n=1 Tax=Phytophthora cinnamomi TaxID=4785 RepID=UPI0035599261|nr:Cyclin-like protein [Phytophthora cinnamomi]